MEKIRLKIKSFDPAILDRFAKQIAVTARSTGATVSGPIPLPTKRTLFAVIRGPHIESRRRMVIMPLWLGTSLNPSIRFQSPSWVL
jgi:ribosomal protein S10